MASSRARLMYFTDLLLYSIVGGFINNPSRISVTNSYFSYVFYSFSLLSPFFMPKSEWLPLTESKRSCCSLLKSDCERFAPVAHDKRRAEAIRSFSKANSSFTHKKWVIHLKNRWANFQPCFKGTVSWEIQHIKKLHLGPIWTDIKGFLFLY